MPQVVHVEPRCLKPMSAPFLAEMAGDGRHGGTDKPSKGDIGGQNRITRRSAFAVAHARYIH
jgi:hypothetical protein